MVLIVHLVTQPRLRRLSLHSHLFAAGMTVTTAVLVVLVCDAMALDLAAAIIVAIVATICAQMATMTALSARHRLLWMMARRNLLRHKRNTALMMHTITNKRNNR